MFLSRQKSGLYYLFFFDDLGKRHKVSTRARRKSDALKFLQSFKERDHVRQARLQRTTLSLFAEDYLKHSEGVHRPNTTETYKTACDEFIRIVGDLPLHRIGVREVERFLAQKKAEASEWTARKYFISLSSAFETALRWNLIRRNPFREVQKPKTREIAPAIMTKRDFLRLMEAVTDDDLRALCLCAVSTGLRLAELIALQWTDLDLEKKLIHVRNSETFTTKSGKNRVVPMNDHILAILTKRKEGASNALVFHLRGHEMTRWYVAKGFKRTVKAAGLDSRLHFHSLRHTFASWLVQDGVSLYAVQKLLGHSSIAVTQVYSHLQPEQLHETVNRLKIT